MVNLTILASRILAALLEETPTLGVTLLDLAVDPPAVWGSSGAELTARYLGHDLNPAPEKIRRLSANCGSLAMLSETGLST